jgi:hypothetical protein
MDTQKFIIRQISIFSENRPGRLAAIAHALGEENINILAFSIAEANGFGVVRALSTNRRRLTTSSSHSASISHSPMSLPYR